ncbi:MAG: SDR family oxidoreductase [bacterium]
MKKKTIWLIGSGGKLGTVLLKRLQKQISYKIITTGSDIDVSDIDAVSKAMEIYRPNIIINCASISNVDYCETHRLKAYRVNALGARNLASLATQHNAKLIHFSTDHVFYGTRHLAKNEFDQPNPISVYGKSKAAGEQFIQSLCPRHLIIRSSWIYGYQSGYSYYDEVLEHGKNNETFFESLDIIGTPTNAEDIAGFVEKVLESNEYGLYHVTAKGACSRLTYARKILELNGYDPNLVQPQYASENAHTVSTVLENLMLELTNFYTMPDWEKALVNYATANKENK